MAGRAGDQRADSSVYRFKAPTGACIEIGNGLLELFELPGEILVRGKQFSQLQESSHYVDAHLDSSIGVQDGCRHDGAMLSEDVRQITAAAASFGFRF